MELVNSNYILFWFCIIGLCLGSFFNVIILRSLSDESIVFPPSKCPKCGERLKPWHNIPVISYLFLRGKCAFCKEKISLQYPIIEIITMGLFALCFIKFGLTWKCLFAIILSSSLLIMTMTDLKEKLIDCNIAIGFGIVGIIYNWFVNGVLLESIYGLLLGIILMELIARSGYLFTNDRAFGEGDTYIAGALGACFGLSGLIQILFNTLIVSMIFIIPMFLYKQYKNKNKAICILFIIFIISALAFKTISQDWYFILAIIISGLWLVISILKNLKQDSCPMYLPLVPAFSIGALYFLFI